MPRVAQSVPAAIRLTKVFSSTTLTVAVLLWLSGLCLHELTGRGRQQLRANDPVSLALAKGRGHEALIRTIELYRTGHGSQVPILAAHLISGSEFERAVYTEGLLTVAQRLSMSLQLAGMILILPLR